MDLIVRGICGLVPGVPGLSENIRVKSLLGRFLEHSRVFHFQNAPIGKRTFLGSPDWMPRNFFRRIEVAFPIEEEVEEQNILDSMEAFLQDNQFASELKSTGKYSTVRNRKRAFSVQEILIKKNALKMSQERKIASRRSSGETENQSEGDQKNSQPNDRVS